MVYNFPLCNPWLNLLFCVIRVERLLSLTVRPLLPEDAWDAHGPINNPGSITVHTGRQVRPDLSPRKPVLPHAQALTSLIRSTRHPWSAAFATGDPPPCIAKQQLLQPQEGKLNATTDIHVGIGLAACAVALISRAFLRQKTTSPYERERNLARDNHRAAIG